ncbi:MAG: hypothetical protein ABFD94_17305 [Armatimonadia bacterium]
MRYTALSVVLALFLVVAADAQTPQQYATGTCWEASLASSPEVSLFGAASVAATGGNIYVLHGNTLVKLGPDMRELASVQLPDLSLAVAAVENKRFEITCGMQGPELGYVYGPQAPLTTYGDGWMNTCGSAVTSTDTQTGVQQCVDQNMLQGLHQAHILNTLSQATLAADQYGVYLLRGGRVTVFDQDLREIRSKDIIQPVATASECPIWTAMMSNSTIMDQLRFRGMNAGLCPGPGQYQYGWNRSSSGTLVPASYPETPLYPETPASVGGTTGVSAPGPTGLGPGANLGTPGTATAGTATSGTTMSAPQGTTPRTPTGFGATTGFGTGVTIPTGFGTTVDGTSGTGTAAPTGAGAVSGTGFGVTATGSTTGTTSSNDVVIPTGFGSSLDTSSATETTATGTRGTGMATGPNAGTPAGFGNATSATGAVRAAETGAGAKSATVSSANTGYAVVTNNEVETGFETEAPVQCPDPRTGQYGWMWDLPQMVPGAIYPVARRQIPGGNVFLGVSGDRQRGPQQLHVHVLLPDGKPDPQAQIVGAYLYQRGDVDAGRTLTLQKHAPGEYMIRFEPANMRGDTLAVRVSRPNLREEVIYLPLSGPEPDAAR